MVPPGMRRSIGILVGVAVVTTLAIVVIVALTRPASSPVAKGEPVPNISGTTLDGQRFDLAALRGHPVLINFWGPTCGPCRDEFPLFKAKLGEHAADGLVVVGILTDDPVDLARTFVSDEQATWQTVIDPGAAIKKAYNVIGRPQTYFVDRSGILRSIQIGWLQDKDFERQYGLISGGG
jgi:cytochrome c biogenesis protein CcmG, thiol:disulfide interchange protein DsbE